jgi:hypothetical protein
MQDNTSSRTSLCSSILRHKLAISTCFIVTVAGVVLVVVLTMPTANVSKATAAHESSTNTSNKSSTDTNNVEERGNGTVQDQSSNSNSVQLHLPIGSMNSCGRGKRVSFTFDDGITRTLLFICLSCLFRRSNGRNDTEGSC